MHAWIFVCTHWSLFCRGSPRIHAVRDKSHPCLHAVPTLCRCRTRQVAPLLACCPHADRAGRAEPMPTSVPACVLRGIVNQSPGLGRALSPRHREVLTKRMLVAHTTPRGAHKTNVVCTYNGPTHAFLASCCRSTPPSRTSGLLFVRRSPTTLSHTAARRPT